MNKRKHKDDWALIKTQDTVLDIITQVVKRCYSISRPQFDGLAEMLESKGFKGERVKLFCIGLGSLEESFKWTLGDRSVDSSEGPLHQFAFISFLESRLSIKPDKISISEPKQTSADKAVLGKFKYSEIVCEREERVWIEFENEFGNDSMLIVFLPNLDNPAYSDFIGTATTQNEEEQFSRVIVISDNFLAREHDSIKDEQKLFSKCFTGLGKSIALGEVDKFELFTIHAPKKSK